MVGSLLVVGLTHGVGVGSTHHKVAVGLVGNVTNLDEWQPLIDNDDHYPAGGNK